LKAPEIVIYNIGPQHELADADVLVLDVNECVDMILPTAPETKGLFYWDAVGLMFRQKLAFLLDFLTKLRQNLIITLGLKKRKFFSPKIGENRRKL
jgi:hypothetical protein